MRTFWSVLKNNYLRSIPRLTSITFITIITMATMVLAIYITGLQEVKGHVVFITNQPKEVVNNHSKHLDITVSDKKPPRSDLVKQKYDAFITIDDNGHYQIESLRNKEFKKMVITLLENPDIDIKEISPQRGVGVNIVGFMMMFLLLISFSNLFGFADDKEQGQLKRITAAPASFGGYLWAHCVYCITIFLPEYLLLIIMKDLGFRIGFSLLEYGGIMVVLAFFGISVGLILNTLIQKPDNAMMFGNSIMILTCVLSGSFYSFTKNNEVLDRILMFLPQKEFMDFVEHMQDHNQWEHVGSLLYIIVFSIILFVLSCMLLRQKYVKRV